jgi:carboxypeptidase T
MQVKILPLKPTFSRLTLSLVLLLIGCLPALADSEVIRVHAVPQERLAELRLLGDFWGVNWREDYVNLHVTPRGREAVEALGYRVEPDVHKTAELERFRAVDRVAWRQAGLRGIPGFPCYRTVAETQADLSALASSYPDLARWETIGESWLASQDNPGGDQIHVLVIGRQDSLHPQEPLIIMAAQHARELSTAEAAARFAEWLLHNHADDPTANWLLDHREIHIIAQQNPDGRRAVEDGSSMWRKNRNYIGCGGSTPGVDLNRNSDVHWGEYSSGLACDQTYRGTGPASEPETQAIHDYLQQVFQHHWPEDDHSAPHRGVAPSMDAAGIFLSLHSYGELILFPWEGRPEGASHHAPNHDQLAWLGRKFGFFTDYRVGRGILYPAGGTTVDYAYGEFGVAAYTYEIGTSFQQSCASFEQQIWPDVLASLIYAAKAAERPYQLPSGPDVIGLEAIHDAKAGQLLVNGLADDSRYHRGAVSEGPANDPIFDIVNVTASFDLPPHLADESFSLDIDGVGSVVGFSGSLAQPEWDGQPRLLFVQAFNGAGHAGVPEAIWVRERLASIAPESIELNVATGEQGNADLLIANIGSSPFVWSISAEFPSGLRSGHEPALDESLSLADFSLPGGGSHNQTAVAGLDSRGQVVGFSFQGNVSGISGTSTWASDLAMTVTSPEGVAYSVGGYNTGHPPWQFDGSGSSNDGSYASSHIGEALFGPDGVTDAGDWQFDFVHSYQDTMHWSDVSVTLHKRLPPECTDPEGVDWLQIQPAEGLAEPGVSNTVGIVADATKLMPGDYQAQLCVTTDDPSAPLVVVPVSLLVTEAPDPEPELAYLEGTVTSLGYCQDNPVPAAAALVQVQGQQSNYTLSTDSQGGFAVQLPPDEAPLNLTVSLLAHRSESVADIDLSLDETTELNLALVLRLPCARLQPDELELTVTVGDQAEGVLELGNQSGGEDLEWSLRTDPGCFDPAEIDWLVLTPAAGVLAWGAGRELSLWFDSQGLAPGQYQTAICLHSSDPEAEEQVVNVQFEVRAAEIFQDRFE